MKSNEKEVLTQFTEEKVYFLNEGQISYPIGTFSVPMAIYEQIKQYDWVVEVIPSKKGE